MATENHTQPPRPDRVWILDQFKQRDLTQKAVAEQMGVDPATLSYTIKGDRKLNLEDLQALSHILHLPAAEIAKRWGYSMKVEQATIALRCYVRDDCTLEKAPEPFSLIPSPPGLATDSYAIQVRSTGAPTAFLNGMICFVPEGSFDIGHSLGQLVVATTTDGQQYFGELSRSFITDGEPLYNITHPLAKTLVQDLCLRRVQTISWIKRG